MMKCKCGSLRKKIISCTSINTSYECLKCGKEMVEKRNIEFDFYLNNNGLNNLDLNTDIQKAERDFSYSISKTYLEM